MKRALLLLGLITAALSPGCQMTQDAFLGVADWTNDQWSAQKAWSARSSLYDGVPDGSSFKSGFKAGYLAAVAGDGPSEPPAPHHYWRMIGQSDSGRVDALAYSDGFMHGSLAAQQDGVAAGAVRGRTKARPEMQAKTSPQETSAAATSPGGPLPAAASPNARLASAALPNPQSPISPSAPAVGESREAPATVASSAPAPKIEPDLLSTSLTPLVATDPAIAVPPLSAAPPTIATPTEEPKRAESPPAWQLPVLHE